MQVSRDDATVGLVDIIKIEQKERARLSIAHLKKAQKSTQVIADKIYRKLEDLHDTLLESIGVRSSSESEVFDLEAIIPRSTCHAQIEALVMRVAFPVGTSYLRWGRNHPNRKLSFEELKRVCSEIPLDE